MSCRFTTITQTEICTCFVFARFIKPCVRYACFYFINIKHCGTGCMRKSLISTARPHSDRLQPCLKKSNRLIHLNGTNPSTYCRYQLTGIHQKKPGSPDKIFNLAQLLLQCNVTSSGKVLANQMQASTHCC